MKKTLLFAVSLLLYCSVATAHIFPLSMESRVNECQTLVMGKVINTVSYWDARHENIYTLHEIEITGYLKGRTAATHIGLVDLGGTVGTQMQETHPSVHLGVGDVGVFMLGGDVAENIKAPNYLAQSAIFIQALPTASIQGAILYQDGVWHDASQADKIITTQALFNNLQKLTANTLTSPTGELIDMNSFVGVSQASNKTLAVTTLQDGSLSITNTFSAGVSNNASKEMIINGSGFGSTAGTIRFPDADAGGGANTFIFPGTSAANYSERGAPTDIISWTPTQIRIRVPPNAGTGTMEVFNSSNVSQGTANITIDYALSAIYSSFSGFASETSQFVKLINSNTLGGYTFNMSSSGSANLFTNNPAKAALIRAFETWRCGTSVHFTLNLAAATTTGYASDNENVILFDNSLPSGVLGRATSRFNAGANALCNMHNTLWRTSEIDIQFQVIPAVGFTWNYNSGGTAANQFSFETVALHEIGHGHGMGHVIDNNKVMHYASSNGTQNVTLAASDIAAGAYKVNNSAGLSCMVTPTPMVPLVNPCAALGANLLRFHAQIVGQDNDIQWTTTNDEGVVWYEVEHSIDGNDFRKIGKAISQKSAVEYEYNFIHEKPETNSNYYRLKIVDAAEKISYSKSILLQRKDKNDFAIFPNPTKGELYINLVGMPLQENVVKYSITDVNGKLWLSKNELVSAQNQQLTADMRALPSGMYFVQLSINGKNSVQKIVKQ